ncbi:fasciclin-like arabinogalactan protein 1 [Trifolium pratense]|uniref:Uncharacterized protein n=1 Tax=Trifolium pratense TaxID=57577 RepID=A0ACB0J507_TRIPR|nr:fasciclin-like arabinogalactan protein 1 [Trifolium pratense]CAJ2640068.1 unnamed protein product [Trifolium pratense]
MQNFLRPSPMAAFTAALLFISTIFTTSNAHNITAILSKDPEFSTFNHYLTLTHLAPAINGKQTITVLAVDNDAMHDLTSKNLSISTVKNILSLHVLLDYYDTKKLHQITKGTTDVATMYQTTGAATGIAGHVNITVLRGGKVGFGAQDNDGTLPATYVKSIQEIPSNISVLQISQILPSASAEAPTPPPTEHNITDIMSKQGCKSFAETLAANPDAFDTFNGNLNGGLTVFCPADKAFNAFLPKFKNLTTVAKIALLEFHGIPVYQSKDMLKSSNGPMNTLATDRGGYDFDVQNDGDEITLKTKAVTAKIMDTIFDEVPDAIFTISKVLLPEELFKGKAQSPSPAPAPEPAAADGPQPPKKKGKKKDAPADDDSDSPADSPDDSADDNADDKNGAAVRFNGIFFMVLSLVLGFLLL